MVVAFAPYGTALAATGTGVVRAAHYDVDATIARSTGTLSATVTITLPPDDIHDGTGFFIGDWYAITALNIGGGITTTETKTSKPIEHLRRIVLHVPHPLQHPVTMRIAYHGKLNGPGTKRGRETFTPSRMELRLEDMWLPLRDDFAVRFTVDARIRGIPHDEVIVSQGQYRHVGDELDLRRGYADFDLPIVAARGLNEFATPSVQVYAADLNSRLVTLLRKHSVGAIDYYEKWFGPIPGGAPVRLVVTDRSGSAYARVGFISVGASREELANNPNYPDYGPASLVAHEFAHAWWSPADPLTDDYWLAESLAEYSSMRYTEQAFGPKILALRIKKKQEESKGAPPILGHGRPTQIDLYAKGPLLLFQLQHDIGRQKMDRVLAILGRKPPHVTDDFLEVLARVAGTKAAAQFHRMLEK
jgi:aminopeptidase N